MEYPEEVKKLAETLKNSGLAASLKDALEKAQSMLGKKESKKEDPVKKTGDTAQTTLSEVNETTEKAEIDESPESENELKKEEVFTHSKSDDKEKKVDLSEIFKVWKKQ